MLEELLRSHPALAGMDKEKLDFILSFAQKDKPKSTKDAMPFLLAYMNQAKRMNLNFSKPEVQLIAEILCKDLPPAEQERVRKMLNMLK